MNINFEKIDNLTIISIRGRLDTTNFEEANSLINQHIDMGEKYFIIDFNGLDYISSTGLRVFMLALKRLKAIHGNMVFANVRPKIKEIFEISGFSVLFSIAPDIESATKKF